MRTQLPFAIACLACALAALHSADAREVRAAARTSVNPPAGRAANVNANANINRNVNRNVNVNHHVDIDVDVDRNYHPWAAAAAVTTAAVVTGAVIGSMVASVPPSCQTVVVGGMTYSRCGSTWYMPQMQGSSITYIVVAPPA